jgi:hypothetical protein
MGGYWTGFGRSDMAEISGFRARHLKMYMYHAYSECISTIRMLVTGPHVNCTVCVNANT